MIKTPWPSVNTSRLKAQFDAATAKPSVVTARNTPRTRSAGNPTAMATNTPATVA